VTDQLEDNSSQILDITGEIVSAYVSKNAMTTIDVPKFIADVHAALKGLGEIAAVPVVPNRPVPSVPIRRSVTPEYLICLDDGKPFKSMKRHLAQLGMTPDEYREKWGLPWDYPMVAPNYSATRSQMAKSNGLGRKAAAPPPPAKPRRGRKAAA
jgi:predicted transcriptional regulator